MSESEPAHRQKTIATPGGWGWLALNLAVLLGGAASVFLAILAGFKDFWPDVFSILLLVAGILAMISGVVLLCGHFTLQPNEASVLILFGAYKGTEICSGFHWANPLYTKKRVSLRSRNLDGGKLKVNDKRGNPIEIAAVVVWRVQDTAQAVFDVDDCEHFVRVQSESAVRHLANSYAYDHGENDEITLRSGGEEVTLALTAELQARLDKAGVEVQEARITHLAYAPEIAQAMLRRQQAEAIIAARRKNRPRRRQHGRNGAPRTRRKTGCRIRRRTQSRHGRQPPRRALRRGRSPSRRQHRNFVPIKPTKRNSPDRSLSSVATLVAAGFFASHSSLRLSLWKKNEFLLCPVAQKKSAIQEV